MCTSKTERKSYTNGLDLGRARTSTECRVWANGTIEVKPVGSEVQCMCMLKTQLCSILVLSLLFV